jgi:hypothetical protein
VGYVKGKTAPIPDEAVNLRNAARKFVKPGALTSTPHWFIKLKDLLIKIE